MFVIGNGMSSPIVFGWELFFMMEVLTIFLEGIVMVFVLPLDKPVSWRRALFMLIVMNLVSAVFLTPMWLMVGD